MRSRCSGDSKQRRIVAQTSRSHFYGVKLPSGAGDDGAALLRRYHFAVARHEHGAVKSHGVQCPPRIGVRLGRHSRPVLPQGACCHAPNDNNGAVPLKRHHVADRIADAHGVTDR